MAISLEELKTIDNQASTKQELMEALHEHGEDQPGLLDITTDDKRAVMIEQAEAVIDDELDDESKVQALERLLKTSPDSRVALRRQAFLRLENEEGEQFVMSAFKKMGTKHIDSRHNQEYLNRTSRTNDVATTALEEVPKWAYKKIYDLVLAQDLQIYETEAKADAAAQETIKPERGMLAERTVAPRMEANVSKQAGGSDLVEIRAGQHSRTPEQDAAWSVLNDDIQGSRPVPTVENRSEDPTDLTEEELKIVRDRVERCIKSPRVFTDKLHGNNEFELPTFLSQLLRLELSGYTAPRNSNDSKISGVTRPQVIKYLRELAKSQGYVVTGSFVREDPARAGFQAPRLVDDQEWKQTARERSPANTTMAHRDHRR